MRLATHSGVCHGCGRRYTINPAADVVRAHAAPDGSGECRGSLRQPRRGTRRPLTRKPSGQAAPRSQGGYRPPGRPRAEVGEEERITREFHCWWCDTVPGDPCRHPQGQVLRYSHAARTQLAVRAGRLPLPGGGGGG